MKTNKILKTIFIICIMVLSIFASGLAYGYFSSRAVVYTNDGQTKIAKIGMEISLLFDRLDPDSVAPGTEILDVNGEKATYDSTATWGSKNNPYIISDIKHLQNLSALQNVGYFNRLFIDKNYDEGGNLYFEDEPFIPYFLVCDNEGNNTTIDGSSYQIEHIGTDEYPFIGYVAGGFNNKNTTVCGLTSDVSAIYGVTITSKKDNVDIGLFTKVGYLGSESEASSAGFKGAVSTIRDLLLADIMIEVNEPSPWEVLASHFFSFNQTSEANVPHENHHIGILAGHVEYGIIQYVSVYYSSSNVTAIDLSHTSKSESDVEANYMTATGIIGFMYNMNPTVVDWYVSAGTGVSSSEVSVSTGTSSGGGLESGTGRGYITAENIYNKYENGSEIVQKSRMNGQQIYSYYVGQEDYEEGREKIGIIVEYDANTDSYYLYNNDNDGSYNDIPVTITGTGEDAIASVNGNNWEDYIIYYSASGLFLNKTFTEEIFKFDSIPLTIRYGVSIEDGTNLCTEYIRSRLIFGTENTGCYYFSDGVFTFALSDDTDVITDTWSNETPDQIYLGSNDANMWRADTRSGNKAVAAYIKSIKTNSELDNAFEDGKQLFIMRKLGNNRIFVMTLYEQSTAGSGDPSKKYYTSGIEMELSDNDSDLVLSLIESYEAGLGIPSDITADYNTKDKLVAALRDGSLNVINLGSMISGYNLSQIRQRFNVTASATNNKSYYYDSGTPAILTNNQIADFYNYQGYFTVHAYSGTGLQMFNTYRDYKYYPADGSDPIDIATKVSGSNPTNVLDKLSVGEREQGNDLYRTKSGTTYTGVLVDIDKMIIYGTSTSVTLGGGKATIPIGTPYDYFEIDVEGNATYSKTGEVIDSDLLSDTGRRTTGGQAIYSHGGDEGLLLYSYEQYTLHNGNNYLRMMGLYDYTNLIGAYGDFFAIWNGTDSYASTRSNFAHTFTVLSTNPSSVSNNKNCTIVFNNDTDGSCYLKYNLGVNVKYVSYSSTNGGSFIGSDSNSSNDSKLYIYSIEGMQNVDYGVVSYVPKDEDVNSLTLNCDEYILMPQTTATPSATTSTDPVYDAVSVSSLPEGWNNELGIPLNKNDLHMMFDLTYEIQWGTTISFLNGNFGIGSDGINSATVVAPIGSQGYEANIPKGCVAFRINKPGDSKIRVIVSCAVSPYYRGQVNDSGNSIFSLDMDEDYYFALWKTEAAGERLISTFNKNNSTVKFELPRSYPYEPGTTPNDSNDEYVLIDYEGNRYRSYLNGSRVLIGYEFNVSEEGVYILGATNGPMEIVYFSADGAANGGRDGSGGSKVGTIDFVYDYNGNIITVKDYESLPATEDYNYYYASLCLLFSNNAARGFPNINNLQISIVRTASSRTTLDLYVRGQSEYLSCLRYASESDEVHIR